jgi:uncharacterized protein (DUF1697 family)
MCQYVAFLRGINVGSHKKVPMEKLRDTLTSVGCEKVKTVQASGNVLFEATEHDMDSLTERLRATLAQTFGFEIPITLRPYAAIEALVKRSPFKEIPQTPDTRLYVTFLPKRTSHNKALQMDTEDFRILETTESEVLSALKLTPQMGTADAMALLDKHYGKEITTRNWNTVCKLIG